MVEKFCYKLQWFMSSSYMRSLARNKNLQADASFSGSGPVAKFSWLAGRWRKSEVLPTEFSTNWVSVPAVCDSLRNNINFLELVACLLLLIRGKNFSGHGIRVLSDNTQAVAVLNRATTKKSGSFNLAQSSFLQ